MAGRLSRWLRTVLAAETRTGVITIVVAIIAIAFVNSPLAGTYDSIIHAEFGFPGLVLDIHHWAADFLLAFFFFVIGIELRHEFTVGSLNTARKALVPVAGATLMAGREALAQAKLDENDAQAKALGYLHDATKVDPKKQPKWAKGQTCGNCQLFQGKANDAWGGCPLFGGKQVAGKGWCNAWVKKA